MGAIMSNVFPVCHSSMMARLQFISLWTAAKHRQGWKKPGFLKKNQHSVFLFFFWVFWVFGVFLVFYMFAQKREDFLGFFQFQEYF
jgi:hypothetical protein